MKLFNLTYNELIKQFKKTSIKLIFPITLVIAIILPIVINNINIDMDSKYAEESNEYMLQDIEKMLKDLEADTSQKGKIQKAFYGAEKEYRELYTKNKIGFDDWRSKEADEFREAAYNLVSIECVLDGYKQDILIDNLQGGNPDEVGKYYEMTLTKKKELEKKFTLEKEKYKTLIENKDYLGHIQSEIDRKKTTISNYKKNISDYEKLNSKKYKTQEEKDKLIELEKLAKEANKNIPMIEQDIELLSFRLNNKINYDNSNWKNNSIKAIEEELIEFRVELKDEKEYSAEANINKNKITYEEYVKNYEIQNNKRIDKMKELWYGLETNIPDIGAIKDARSTVDNTYELFVIIAVLVVIVIGGGIVSSEFSNGTIRLLLIRPVHRWKILLSKLLAVTLVGFAVVTVGVIVLVISSGFIFGFDTLEIPLLETINGTIIHVDYISFMINKLIISTSSIVFIISLVLMVGTLSKNTALAVAISMIVYLGSGPIVSMLLNMGQLNLINTFLPYINGSYFKLMPSLLEWMSTQSGIEMQYALGGKQLLIISLIMLILTFVTFVKRDVKN